MIFAIIRITSALASYSRLLACAQLLTFLKLVLCTEPDFSDKRQLKEGVNMFLHTLLLGIFVNLCGQGYFQILG